MRLRTRRGFTLTELVATLTLIGILAAVSGPRFFSLHEFSDGFFFDETLSGLRFARGLAVATGCEVQVDFSAGGWTARQRTACDTGAFSLEVIDPSNGSASFAGTAPPGLGLASDVDPLVFDALGRALDSTGTVSDAAVSVGARIIAIDGESGFLREF